MDRKAANFLKKKGISSTDIIYIIHKDRKTALHLEDGTVHSTFISLKYILSALPKGTFLNINKGIAVSADKIKDIKGSSYTMCDGTVFTGRKRSYGEHRQNRRALENTLMPAHRVIEDGIRRQFSVIDDSPMPCFVVEALLDSAGHPVDLAFVYCNQAMASYEGQDIDEMMESTVYRSIKNADFIWLNVFSDVIINGKSRIIEGFKPEKGEDMTLYCWRPSHGYCACMLVPGKVRSQ